MKSNILGLVVCVFPILGLISCAQDKKPVAQQDSWRLSEPQITSALSPEVEIKLRHSGLRKLPGDALLNFKASQTRGVVFEVNSGCQSPSGFFESTQKLRLLSKIPLASLIPQKMWLTQPVKEIERSHCSFKFVATNSIGSIHKFEIENVQFSRLAGGGSASLARKPVLEIDSLDLKEKISRIIASPGEGWTSRSINLVCENFANHRGYAQLSDESTLIHELSNGDLYGESAGEKIDPRNRQTVQSCRVIRQSLNPRTGIKLYSVSRALKLTFPLASAKMKVKEGLRTASMATFIEKQTIYSFTLKNSTGVKLIYRFSEAPGSMVYLQPVFQARNRSKWLDGYVPGTISEHRVSAKVSGAKSVKKDGFIYFSVAANETAKIRIYLNEPLFDVRLPREYVDKNEAQKGHAGFFLAFRKKFALKQLRDWNGDALNKQPAQQWVNVTPFSVKEHLPGMTILPMWQPYDGRLMFDKAGKRPSRTKTLPVNETITLVNKSDGRGLN